VGTSEDLGPMTQFLSHMCFLGCQIDMDIGWPDTFRENRCSVEGDKELLELWEAKWSWVGCMLLVLEKLLNKDKEKIQNLEAKVEAVK
jgi:hypothetical protein